MTYYYLFIWVAVMALFANRYSYYTDFNGYDQKYVTRGFALLVFVPIIYFVVNAPYRYWGDYYAYMNAFGAMPSSISGIPGYLARQKDSYLFYVFSIVIKSIFGNSQDIYRLCLACLQLIPVYCLFRRYSDDYLMSIYLFLATAVPLAWCLNGVRQFCAAAIIYAATPFVAKKQYIKAGMMVLLAYTFHQSAIIMLPIVFVCMGKPWNWKTTLAILAAVIVTVYFSGNSGAADSFLESSGYSAEVYKFDDGVNPLRVLVSFVPVILSFLERRDMEELQSPVMDFCVNMSIMAFGVNLIGMVTSGILVGRMPIYMSLYSFILLPYLIRNSHMFSQSGTRLIEVAMVGFYGVFFYFECGFV